MDSEIEWSPVRSIASAAADERQQLASQAATELRMRSLQVRHPIVLKDIFSDAYVCPAVLAQSLFGIHKETLRKVLHDLILCFR